MKQHHRHTGPTLGKKPKESGLLASLLLWRRAFCLWWKADPRLFTSTAALLLFQTLSPYVTIYFTARLLNEITGACRREVLFSLTGYVLLSTAVLALGSALFTRRRNTLYAACWQKKDQFVIQKLLQMDFEALEQPHTHELIAKIEQGQNFGGWGILRSANQFQDLAGSLVQILGAIILCITLFTRKIPAGHSLSLLNHPLFLLVLATGLVGMTILSPRLINRADSFWSSFYKTSTQGNRIYMFHFRTGMEQDRAMDMRIYRQDLLARNYLGYAACDFAPGSYADRYWHRKGGAYYALSAVVSRLFTGFVYMYVCMKAWAGAFGIGDLARYVSAITALSAGVSSLLYCLGSIRNNAPFLQTEFSFLDIPDRMYQGSICVEKRTDRKYDVEFRDVSFRYPGSKTYALRHVSLRFQIGERLAVVGENGSGKTTMIKLLCRLYDPTEGEILLNGINIRKYDYREYQQVFSVVFQDFRLPAYGLGANVAGSTHYNAAKARRCLEDAGLSPWLAGLPDGLDTCIGREFDENGIAFSGGELQKIAIARALYKDAPFLILDEPTAALDPVAEAQIYASFNTLVQDKTAVYISHRLSSCRFCDRIAVFDRGTLVQCGSHQELVSQTDGKYYALWQAQAQYYQT